MEFIKITVSLVNNKGYSFKMIEDLFNRTYGDIFHKIENDKNRTITYKVLKEHETWWKFWLM